MSVATVQPEPVDLIGRPPPSAFKRKWTYTQACAELPETLLPIEVWVRNEDDYFELQGRCAGRQFAPSALLPGFKVRVDLMLANPLED